MKHLQTIFSIILFIICLFLMLLCIKEKQKQDSLRNEISQLSSKVQEETATPKPHKTVVHDAKSVHEKEAKRQQRHIKAESKRQHEEITDRFFPSKINDRTLEELLEEDQAAYNEFMAFLNTILQHHAKNREEKLRLLADLNPDYLSEEEYKSLYDKLQRSIQDDECVLAFKKTSLDTQERLSQEAEFDSSIITKYCAHAVGIEDVFLANDLSNFDSVFCPPFFMLVFPSIQGKVK
ncbi:MAG: hypothetical protein IKX30_04640 [Victivallales bacterium]|nr:hypothetical protein [Victivallales bacterium]